MPTRDEWQAMLEQQMPARNAYIARNRAITAHYARWYLQEPWLFKWAGMAAFASAQVGVGLALAEMLQAPHGALHAEKLITRETNLFELGVDLYGRALNLAFLVPLALHDAATRPLLLNDLELVKQANDAIFDDVGWAHLAYMSHGLAAVEANLRAGEQAYLLEAFRLMDEGVHRLCDPADVQAGMELIDRAAVTMLRHEQMSILPPYMERMSNPGKLFASLGSWLDFEGVPGLIGQPSFSNYYGPLALLSGTRNVTNAADRWSWIERDVLPKWSRVNAAYTRDCPLHRQLVVLADEQANLLQQTAGLMNAAYLALGFNLDAFNERSRPAAPAAA